MTFTARRAFGVGPAQLSHEEQVPEEACGCCAHDATAARHYAMHTRQHAGILTGHEPVAQAQNSLSASTGGRIHYLADTISIPAGICVDTAQGCHAIVCRVNALTCRAVCRVREYMATERRHIVWHMDGRMRCRSCVMS